MDKKYRVQVFGKAGCEKCKVLNRRLDKILEAPEWQDYEKQYCDVESEEGLVSFCRAQCVNPSRIPALVVCGFDDRTGEYNPMVNPVPGKRDRACGQSELYQFIGLQTDYTDRGRGLITPKMITTVLAKARG